MFWYSKIMGDNMNYKDYENIFNDINNIIYGKSTSKFEKIISLLFDKYHYDLTKIEDYEYLKECIYNYLNCKAQFNNLVKFKNINRSNKFTNINELEICKNFMISERNLKKLINMLCHMVIAKDELEERKLKKIEKLEYSKKENIQSCDNIKNNINEEKVAFLYEENQNHFDKRI